MEGSARTTIFGIFVLARQPLTAPQLIRLAAAVGVTATNVKAHLSRMVGEGVLVRRGPVRAARYSPSSAQRRTVDAIDTRLAGPVRRWNGRWVMVCVIPPDGRYERERAAAALWFDGFRVVSGDVYARPDWPGSWARLGARSHAGRSGVVFVGKPVNSGLTTLAALYDLDGLDADALALARTVERRMTDRDPERAFAARLEVGGEVARFAAHDPLLPDELWAGRRGMNCLRDAYRQFAEATRSPAQAFLDSVLNGASGRAVPAKGSARAKTRRR